MEIDNKLYELVDVFLEEYWHKNRAANVTVNQFIEACVTMTILSVVKSNFMSNDLQKTVDALGRLNGIEEDGASEKK